MISCHIVDQAGIICWIDNCSFLCVNCSFWCVMCSIDLHVLIIDKSLMLYVSRLNFEELTVHFWWVDTSSIWLASYVESTTVPKHVTTVHFHMLSFYFQVSLNPLIKECWTWIRIEWCWYINLIIDQSRLAYESTVHC